MSQKTEVDLFYNGFGGTTSVVARDAHTRITFGEEERLTLEEVMELADRNLSKREIEIEAARILRERFCEKWNAVLYKPAEPEEKTYKVIFVEVKTNNERVVFVQAKSLDEAKQTAAMRINARPKYRFSNARPLEEGETA